MRHKIDVILFDGFELLDVFGPVEFFGALPKHYEITYVAEQPGPVRSSQGAEVIAEEPLSPARASVLLLIPGGAGTRRLVTDTRFLTALTERTNHATVVTSVCTGSAVLAAAGMLTGYRATSNKQAA